MDLTTNLRQDLQALIGPEEEWPDEVRQVVLCYGVEPGESCPDSCSHRPVENCACDVLPSDNVIPALLALAGMVKRGTCGECEHGGFRSCPIWMTYLYGTNVDWFSRDRDDMPDFGCTLFSPTEETK